MAVGSGLSAQLGVAAESTFGTYVAPSKFYVFNNESISRTQNIVQGSSIGSGLLGDLGSRRVLTSSAGSGSFEIDGTNRGLGLLLAHALGSSATPVQQASTTAYLQTHTLGDVTGKSLTLQKGVPDRTGTIRPYTFRGTKITGIEFKCSADNILTIGLDVDAAVASEAETLATASLTLGAVPFHFAQMAFKIGTYGAETVVQGVRGFSLKLTRPLDTGAYYANNAGQKAEQIGNDQPTVTGSIDTDFVDKTVFADRFSSNAGASMIITFTGANIASTYYDSLEIDVPLTYFTDATPQVGGPGIVQPSHNFEGKLDGTHPLLTVKYMSADSTL